MPIKPSTTGTSNSPYSPRNGPSLDRPSAAKSVMRIPVSRGCLAEDKWRQNSSTRGLRLLIRLGRNTKWSPLGANRIRPVLHRFVEDAEQFLLIEHHLL